MNEEVREPETTDELVQYMIDYASSLSCSVFDTGQSLEEAEEETDRIYNDPDRQKRWFRTHASDVVQYVHRATGVMVALRPRLDQRWELAMFFKGGCQLCGTTDRGLHVIPFAANFMEAKQVAAEVIKAWEQYWPVLHEHPNLLHEIHVRFNGRTIGLRDVKQLADVAAEQIAKIRNRALALLGLPAMVFLMLDAADGKLDGICHVVKVLTALNPLS